MSSALDDAIDGLPARQLEQLQARIAKRLQACILCKGDGAVPVGASLGHSGRITLMLCRPCIEQHRLPEGRAAKPG